MQVNKQVTLVNNKQIVVGKQDIGRQMVGKQVGWQVNGTWKINN